MTRRVVVLLSFVTTALSFQSALGQGNRNIQSAGPGGYDRPHVRFEMAPKLGEQLPDVVVVDREGTPINIREVAREHYTVLVLGCLT